MEIFKTTLLPMSIYGFSTTVLGILFSTTVGSLVDTTPRLQGKALDPWGKDVNASLRDAGDFGLIR